MPSTPKVPTDCDKPVWAAWSSEYFKQKGEIVYMVLSQSERKAIYRLLRNFTFRRDDEEIFYHLCFCIMAPQTKYESNRSSVQKLIEADFYRKDIPQEELETIIHKTRFYKNKARFLLAMKAIFSSLVEDLRKERNPIRRRDIVIQRVKGVGLKAASHFLRNMGETTLAIIDTHIMKFLGYSYNSPRGREEYLAIEKKFRDVAKFNRLTPAALDAYVWKSNANVNIEQHEQSASVALNNRRMMLF